MTVPAGVDAPYTVRRVQQMLGLSRTVIDGLIGAGFVSPLRGRRNEHRFTFRDLMLMRTAHSLQAANIPPRKILSALTRLHASLPAEMPLTGLRITAVGSDIVVRDRLGGHDPVSGQHVMDFEVSPVHGGVAFLPPAGPEPATHTPSTVDAASWFARGEAAEAAHPADEAAAEAAYRRAVAVDPDFADAWLNLGAMLCESGRCAEAVAVCSEAVEQCPDAADLHFNRAIALEDQGDAAGAISAYERCLALDASIADAHFNCARLRERTGDSRGALRHLNAYRRLRREPGCEA